MQIFSKICNFSQKICNFSQKYAIFLKKYALENPLNFRIHIKKMQYSLLLLCGKIQKIVLPLLAEKLDILDLGDVLSNHNFVSK